MAKYRVRVEFGSGREVVVVTASDMSGAVRKALRVWATRPSLRPSRTHKGRVGDNGWVNCVRVS